MPTPSTPSTPPGRSSASPPERLVVDASALVDLLLGTDLAIAVDYRLRRHELHAPAHLDAEVLSALGRIHRAGELGDAEVAERLDIVSSAAIERHELSSLLIGAWNRRHTLRLVDALYVELAERLNATLVTTDAGLAVTTGVAELIETTY
jgi:predicted nucleic acid-binding protein